MNISSLNRLNTINFGNRNFESYLDDMSEPYEDEIIPEYEELENPKTREAKDFMRLDELYDSRKGDRLDYYYRSYASEDDVAFNDDIIYDLMPKSNRAANYVTSPRDSLPANYYLNNLAKDVYCADDAYNKEHESFQIRLNQGFKKEDISQIYHSAMRNITEDKKTMDYNLAKKGFNLLESGKPVELVTSVMDGSKIAYADGTTVFKPELFDFLALYPNSRKFVVENKGSHEKLHSDIIAVFSEMQSFCKDEKEIGMVINSCKTGDSNDFKVDKELAKMCSDMVKNGQTVENATKLIKKSILTKEKGTKVFSQDLFNFLSEYPNDREMVVKDNNGEETVRKDIIDTYGSVKKVTQNPNEISQIVNACQVGSRNNQRVDSYVIKLCTEMIKNGKSVEDATSDINDAKLKSIDRGVIFDKDLFNFLQEYPDSRNYVVENREHYSLFRKDRANIYPELLNHSAKFEDIGDIMESCELYNSKEGHRIDRQLVNLAEDLLDINSEWTKNHDRIMSGVKSANGYYGYTKINPQKYELAKTMSENGNYSINSIYSAVVLNMKNVELLK